MYSSAMIPKVQSTDEQKRIPGSLLEMPNLRPHLDLYNQGLHFNKIPWKAVSTWKFEKHSSRARSNWEKNDVRNDDAETNHVLDMCHGVYTDQMDWRCFLKDWCDVWLITVILVAKWRYMFVKRAQDMGRSVTDYDNMVRMITPISWVPATCQTSWYKPNILYVLC